jgi:prefoldin subunit 5
MYENTHFKDKIEAIAKAVEEYKAGISLYSRRKSQLEEELQEANNNVTRYEGYVKDLQALYTEQQNKTA